MNFKAIALTAAVMAGSFGAANAASYTTDDLGLSYPSAYAFKSTVATADNFWTILSSLTTTNGYGSVYSYFSSFLHTGETLEGLSDVSKMSARGTSSTTSWLGQLDFNSATSTISFTGSTISGGTVTPISQTVTAVPGPEAGAGLGALAMLGVAYWAKRRRDGQALAA